MIKSAPIARQTESPGRKLMTGRLLNQLVEAMLARTPLNAAAAGAKGYSGVATKGGTEPAGSRNAPRFDAGRVYVVPAAFLASLSADLRARMPTQTTQRLGMPSPNAEGVRALLRGIREAEPQGIAATTPDGLRLKPAPRRVAALKIELQTTVLSADMCAISTDSGSQEFVKKQTTVNHFENGDVTSTVTAAGNIRVWQLPDAPTDCDAIAYANDSIPGFDYGAFVSSNYSEERVPFSDVWDAAVAALSSHTPASSELDFSWPQDQWRTLSAGGWGGASLGTVGATYDPGSVSLGANSVRWRAVNTGQCHIKLFWRQTGAGGTELATGSLDLPRNATSDWQEPPTPPTDPASLISLTLSAINLGPYR